MMEFGFPSYPSYETLQQYSSVNDRSISSSWTTARYELSEKYTGLCTLTRELIKTVLSMYYPSRASNLLLIVVLLSAYLLL
jgi:hypothetical protein